MLFTHVQKSFHLIFTSVKTINCSLSTLKKKQQLQNAFFGFKRLRQWVMSWVDHVVKKLQKVDLLGMGAPNIQAD